MGKQLAVKEGRSDFDSLTDIKNMLLELKPMVSEGEKFESKKLNYIRPANMCKAVSNATEYGQIALDFESTGKGINIASEVLKLADPKNLPILSEQISIVNSLLCASAMLRSLGFVEFADYLQKHDVPILCKQIVDAREKTVKRSVRRQAPTAQKHKALTDRATKLWELEPHLTLDRMAEKLMSEGVTTLAEDQLKERIRKLNPNQNRRGRTRRR